MKDSKYIIPDLSQLKHEMILKYKSEFLSLNDLKIGDTVILPFRIPKLVREKSKEYTVSFTKDKEAILKEDENGYLYAESIEDLPNYKLFTFETKRGRYKEEYKCTYKKLIIKIGSNLFK